MGLLFSDLTLNNNGGNLVTFGNRGDVCLFELRDLVDNEKLDMITARKRLAGKLEGVKVVKFRHSGAEIVISLDFIHRIAEMFPKETAEVTEDAQSETAD